MEIITIVCLSVIITMSVMAVVGWCIKKCRRGNYNEIN